jgi:hypothetical protein
MEFKIEKIKENHADNTAQLILKCDMSVLEEMADKCGKKNDQPAVSWLCGKEIKMEIIVKMKSEVRLEKLMNDRHWYAPLGIRPQAAQTYKKRYFDGTMKKSTIRRIMLNLGIDPDE